MRLMTRWFKISLIYMALTGFLVKPLLVLSHSFQAVSQANFCPASATLPPLVPILVKLPSSDQRMRVLEREKDPSDLLGLQVAQADVKPLPGRFIQAPVVFESFPPPRQLVLRI